MKNVLNREQLLAKEKIEVKEVDLGNENVIYVKQMTGKERDDFEQSVLRTKKDAKGKTEYEAVVEDFRTKLIVKTACDEKGNLIFNVDDARTLSQNMSAKTIDKIVEASQELNGISEKDKEDLIKN